jgi:hypothetical protein
MCLAIMYKCREHRPAAAAARPMQGPPWDLGLTQRIFFFLEPVTLTPTWMRSMVSNLVAIDLGEFFEYLSDKLVCFSQFGSQNHKF